MKNSYHHTIIITLLTSSGHTISILLAVMLSDQEVSIEFIVLVGLFILINAFVIWLTEQKLGKDRKKIQDDYESRLEASNKILLEEILDIACQITSSNTTRACVFLLNSRKKELYIHHHSKHRFSNQELKLKFGVQEGVVGFSFWYDGAVVIGEFNEKLTKEEREYWRLKPHHIKYTSQLRTILAIPIPLAPNSDKIIGVLSFDSKEHLKDTGFDDEKIVNLCLIFAEKLVQFIPERLCEPITRPRNSHS